MENKPNPEMYNRERMKEQRIKAFEIAREQLWQDPDNESLQDLAALMAEEAGISWPPDLSTEED